MPVTATELTLVQAIVLGIVQGLAEFLPISSSGHLLLTPYVFGWQDPGLAFDVALHIGTLIAVLWYFKQEWWNLIQATLGILKRRGVASEEERRVIYLIIATIPGAIAGVLLNDYAETVFRSPRLVAINLIVMGVVLWAVDRWAPRDRGLGNMKWRDAILVGFAQCLALVPGVSRSGSTITAGRALGFTRESAAVFSFLMSMPITAAAAALKTPEAVKEYGVTLPMIVGIVASAASGWMAIAVLIKLVARRGYGIFAVYRVILGAIILYLLATRGAA
jgi:undecaprenyl-diphosphatase